MDKSVLYFAPLGHTYEELCASVRQRPSMTIRTGGGRCEWRGPGLALRVQPATTTGEALEQIQEHYYNLVLIDCRHLPHHESDSARQEAALYDLLDGLRKERDRERRYPFQRIVVLVGDADEERVDRLIFALGENHVGACVRDLSLSPRLVESHAELARDRMIEQLWELFHDLLIVRHDGKKAISLAGGGVTGIYYEFGVLKCLHDAMDVDLGEFDMYLGISAGAIVASCLANGFHIDEIIANAGQLNGSWGKRLRLDWRQLNIGAIPRRMHLAGRHLASDVGRILRMESGLSLSSLFGASGTLLGPMFDNHEIERFLRRLFSLAGRSNDFRQLGRELFVGATDQDLRRHVLFGEDEFRDVPISKAVQASAAVHPFFPSVRIDGRYYTDGAITRTSNLRAAIRHGADLLFVIDPFVPLITDDAGHNERHGNLWIMEQDFKTLAYTRFELVSEEILRRNPQVNTYCFVPSNRMRRLMSQNPFAARNFHPIVCESYKSTYRRLRQLEYKIGGELGRRGIQLDLDPVARRVRRLERAGRSDVGLLVDLPAGRAAATR